MSEQLNRLKRADAFKVATFVSKLDMTQHTMQSLVEIVRESLKILVTAQSLRNVLVDAEMPMPSRKVRRPSKSVQNNGDRLVAVAMTLLNLMRKMGEEIPPELKAIAYRTSLARIVEGQGRGEEGPETGEPNIPMKSHT